MATSSSSETNRRDFLKKGTAATVTAGIVASNLNQSVYANSTDTLRVGLIGCGGRGTGAANQALSADPQTKLVAMGDAFADQIDKSHQNLINTKVKGQVEVPEENRFAGFDAYKHVIDNVDVVLLTTPPHFRPEQLKAAVDAGKHVFVEKPVAVDAAGVRSILETCEVAKKKNLSIVSGLCWRYHYGMRETFQQVHDGNIGDVVAMQCSYNTRGLWKKDRQESWSDMEWQLRNWLYFTWLSGDFITEQHIHSLDKIGWTMHDEPPVRCNGTGGRQTRTEDAYGHVYDHFAVVYEYANGVKAFSRCRQQDGCAVDVSDHVIGTEGRADVFKHRTLNHKGERMWQFRGKKNNMYQTEHDEFFASIRSGKPINNGEYMSRSTMMAIMGRMAAYTGQTITWEDAMNSKEVLKPERYDWISMDVPPIAMPGITAFS
ncbi:MAG: oxidoreductase [Planctomycetaceae bacterium]|nr:oxidoreductase [Planctomycetaceae bacterium]